MFSKFGAYSRRHGLMVIDMQSEYLEPGGVGQCHIGKLITNISNEVQRCLTAGGTVYFVEYEGYGETIPQLYGGHKDENEGITILGKDDDDLLNSSPRLCRIAKKEMKKLYRSGTLLTIGGVNTSACVRRTANSINRIGISVNIPAGLTLDICNDCSADHNNIRKLLKLPWNGPIFHTPDGKNGKGGYRGNLKDFL